MTDPAPLIVGFLGRGPASRMALIGVLMGRGTPYVDAEIAVGRALLALNKVGRVESFSGDVWRLTATAAPMESTSDPT